MTNKQQKIVDQAVQLAGSLSKLEPGERFFFGNEGVSVYRDGHPGDIIGYLLLKAGALPKVVVDETDPKVALALALGTTVYALPENLQNATNVLAIAGDDTKRSYARRIPKLVKLLDEFAETLSCAKIDNVVTVPKVPHKTTAAPSFVVPGKTIR